MTKGRDKGAKEVPLASQRALIVIELLCSALILSKQVSDVRPPWLSTESGTSIGAFLGACLMIFLEKYNDI